MSVSTTIPATVQIKRGRLFGLVVGIAVLAAAVTWVLSAYAFQNGKATTETAAPAIQGYMSYLGTSPSSRTASIMSLTPGALAANALGTGYALPSVQEGPSATSVLASLSPETRDYTKAIMNLTFAQLAAGAAGHP